MAPTRLSHQSHGEHRSTHFTVLGHVRTACRQRTKDVARTTGHGLPYSINQRRLLNMIDWIPHFFVQATTLPSAVTPKTLLHIFHDQNATNTETGTNGGGPSDAWGAAEKYPDEWK